MPRLLLKLAFLFVLVLSTTGLAARNLSSTQPLNAIMREFVDGCENQPQPCWQGIVPGATTVEAATALLTSRGYVVIETTSAQLTVRKSDAACQKLLMLSGKIIQQINLQFCEPLLLGDFMEQNSQPDTVMLDPLSIWYRGQMQILFVPQFASWDMLSYYTPLQEVILFPVDSPLPYQRAAWLDLLTQRKYCQLKGLRYYCAN